MFSNKYHFNSFFYITFKIQDGMQKVLDKSYVQFCWKILNFKGAAMVQPCGAVFFIHPVFQKFASNNLLTIFRKIHIARLSLYWWLINIKIYFKTILTQYCPFTVKEMLQLIERVKRKYKGEKHTIEHLEKRRDEVARTFQGDERLTVDIFLAKGENICFIFINMFYVNFVYLWNYELLITVILTTKLLFMLKQQISWIQDKCFNNETKRMAKH